MFKKGEKVEILRGPHKGMIGIVKAIRELTMVTQYAVELESGKTFEPFSQRMLKAAPSLSLVK